MKDNVAFFAIYDGHGSGLVSEQVHHSLHHLLAQRPEFEHEDWVGAIKEALAEEDRILLERFKHESAEPALSGSTVAICCINLTQGDMVVSNLGDSHVILAERDRKTEHPYHIRRLTEAHKPEMPSEKARIEDAGGAVVNRSGTDRLGSLNMSRALGDLQYKNPVNTFTDNSVLDPSSATSRSESRGNFLSNEPYTSRRTLHTDRRYLLVVVSDGVTDRVDDASLVQHVMKLSMRGRPASEIAQEIATSSANTPHSDNASCIIAMLDGQGS
ncbi:Protein phosphatase 2C [Penicillium paradoxum]|uniref:Protein phosphatase 2C n=1 Tax=Penicillium paradoxum TaxID=176176 RepID=UPI0025490C0B|nr:Protein phosphatase 2C [Penicillium paradoxum]KAJ5773474.1 Protein phosphatase 2C [Penicillium paradoxum]